jgi:hypothetical protein
VEEIPATRPRSRPTANPTTQPALGHLRSESARLIFKSLSANTHRAYHAALQKFNTFIKEYNLPNLWPIPVHVVLDFIAHMSLQKLSPNTVRLYIIALSYFHKLRQVADPTSSFLVSKALQGLARLNKTIDTRYPITISILEKLLAALPSVCLSPYEGKLFASAFVLAYYGLLRVGEFTIDTTTRLQNSHCITFQNLALDRQA